MSVPPVSDFFTNKVNIQLKSGQRFEGLLKSIDYKTNVVVLEDVEDLGNEYDKNCIAHDKKIPEKSFESQNISQIFMKEKHFSEPKKYKKEQFWDAISQPQAAQKDKKYRPKQYQAKKEYKPRRNYEQNNDRNNNYRPRGDHRGEERPQRKYEDRERRPQKEEKGQQEDERGLR